ncbi:MAG: nuclear transport factor 2 family protein [Sphingomonadaceae bacterium]|nr:nuclear transport factor 2 family protein [Sphingomonadaceae bacterium]
MRRLMTAGLIVVAEAGAAAAPPADDVAAITALEDAWRQARIDGDTAFLERFYAAEFRVQGMDGRVVPRADDIGLFARREVRPESIRHGPLDIRVYGDSAVVTGVDDMKGCYRANCGAVRLRFTDVLVRRDGRWQMVVEQATPTTGD